ncbi:MAG: thioesterase family protein [Solirubrobacterales bacterium]
MSSFDADTALTPVADGEWEGSIADGWATPRGPLGGYVMALVLRAFEEAVADAGRTARSATMHFLRPPSVGAVKVRATVERSGRSLTTVSGRLLQEGKLIGIALAAYSAPWESPFLPDEPMPSVDPPEGRDPIDSAGRNLAPDFTQRLTMQRRFGELPFTGAVEGEVGGWIGLVEERPIDALALAVVADAWFPAPWPRLTELAPAPTIDLTVHFRAPLPLDDTLLLGRFRNRVVRDGFFDEDGELWTPDGTLVAQSRQLALLIGAKAP